MAVLAAGCASMRPPTPEDEAAVTGRRIAPGERFRPAGATLSAALPAGWTLRDESGATVLFSDPLDDSRARNTITLRLTPFEGAAGAKPRTPESIAAATKRAIEALPAGHLVAERPAARAGLRGAEFELVFEPRHKSEGSRYARRHIVLVDAGGSRVLHLMHTGRAGLLDRTAREFDAVVASVKEGA